MPPAKKKATSDLCEEHFPGGEEALPVGVTSVGCEHGTWEVTGKWETNDA